MYPRNPWELFADPSESPEHTLGTTDVEHYIDSGSTFRPSVGLNVLHYRWGPQTYRSLNAIVAQPKNCHSELILRLGSKI